MRIKTTATEPTDNAAGQDVLGTKVNQPGGEVTTPPVAGLKGTPILYADSPTFAADFANAIGLQPGEKLIRTPQFERTDGVQVPVLPDFNDWENLHKRDDTTLLALGFGVWDETEKGKHWLFPKEWYGIIPNGYPIVGISGVRKEFKRGETDDDYRFGCLAFGFIKGPQPCEEGK